MTGHVSSVRRSAFLQSFCVFLLMCSRFIPHAAESDDFLPNPNCIYWPADTILNCPGGMDIPGNFDVSKIRKNVTAIQIAGTTFNGTQPAKNILRSDAPALPADLTQLQDVTMNGFTDERDSSISIRRFVANVRARMHYLNIVSSKIGQLEDGFLEGFSQLTLLNIVNSDLGSISATAFGRDNAQLTVVTIQENQLQTLDWAVFEPLSDTLQSLALNSQSPGLTSLNCSRSFKLSKVGNAFSLQNNQLESLSKCVMDSFTYDQNTLFHVEENKFCPTNGDCSCCDMQDFIAWAYQLAELRPTERRLPFTCGTSPNQQSWDLLNLPPQTTHCGNGGEPETLTNGWLTMSTACSIVLLRTGLL